MWRGQFIKELKDIFGFENIIFGSAGSDSQKNVAWVEAKADITFTETKKIAFVTGVLSIVGDPQEMPDARLSEKYQVSKNKSKFIITSKERQDYTMGDNQLKIVSVDFVYEYSVDFNPKKSLITMLWNMITE